MGENLSLRFLPKVKTVLDMLSNQSIGDIKGLLCPLGEKKLTCGLTYSD